MAAEAVRELAATRHGGLAVSLHAIWRDLEFSAQRFEEET
jgi:hypothetical protein